MALRPFEGACKAPLERPYVPPLWSQGKSHLSRPLMVDVPCDALLPAEANLVCSQLLLNRAASDTSRRTHH